MLHHATNPAQPLKRGGQKWSIFGVWMDTPDLQISGSEGLDLWIWTSDHSI